MFVSAASPISPVAAEPEPIGGIHVGPGGKISSGAEPVACSSIMVGSALSAGRTIGTETAADSGRGSNHGVVNPWRSNGAAGRRFKEAIMRRAKSWVRYVWRRYAAIGMAWLRMLPPQTRLRWAVY